MKRGRCVVGEGGRGVGGGVGGKGRGGGGWFEGVDRWEGVGVGVG